MNIEEGGARSVTNSNTFIDETILSTPQPQASSTVERKPSANNIRRRCVENFGKDLIMEIQSLDRIPVKDVDAISLKSNASNLSSQSSLGILSVDNMEDIQDALCDDKKKRTSAISDITAASSGSVSDKLVMQRLLAKKVLDRADLKAKTATVDGLPSYLLKTPGRNITAHSAFACDDNDSTINLSDLERSSLPKSRGTRTTQTLNPEKLSFQTNEISARSSSFGTRNYSNLQKSDLVLTDEKKILENRISELFDRYSTSRLSAQPSTQSARPSVDSCISFTPQDSLIAKFQDELFIPGELASEDIFKQEPEQNASLTINASIDSKFNTLDPAEISLRSKLDDNTSIREFFQRKTQAVDELNLKASPEKKREPVPLVDLTLEEPTRESIMQRPPSLAGLPVSHDLSRLSNSSIMNATGIAEILARMDLEDTPSRVMDYLMKTIRVTSNNDSVCGKSVSASNSSTLKNVQQSSALTDSTDTMVADASDASAKENSPRGKAKPPHEPAARPKSILKDTSNSLVKYIEQNQQNAKTERSESDWADMKSEVERALTNHTLSSIVSDSPASYTCSELDFSEDDQPDSISSSVRIRSDKWFEIPQTQPPVLKGNVGVACEVEVPVTSLINHWLVVRVSLAAERRPGVRFQANLPTAEVLLKAVRAQHVFRVHVIPLQSGRLELVLSVEAVDMVSKSKQTLEHSVSIDVSKPDLQLSTELLNFGLVPENIVKKLPLVVNNLSKGDLLLNFRIEQGVEKVYIFGGTEDTNIKLDKSSSQEMVMKRGCKLPQGRSFTLVIEMHTPALAQVSTSTSVSDLQGKVVVSVGEPSTQVTLREVPLVGTVGLTKMQFRASCMPLVLMPGETKPLQMKNSGMVQMEMSLGVFDSSTDTLDPAFLLEPACISLKPNQSGSVHITYNNTNTATSFTSILKRTVRLHHVDYVGMNFLCDIEVHPPKVNKNVVLVVPKGGGRCASPRGRWSGGESPGGSSSPQPARSSSQNSDVPSAKYLQDGKLPIETTRADLVWGCVRAGKTSTQDFILRNRCNQKIRLQACVSGEDFKIVKDQSEKVNSVLLALQAMESRTISVTLVPRGVGTCSDRLLFLPIDGPDSSTQTKRQRVALFGYGGHASVSVQNVAKDPSGNMWLCFGGLDCTSTLQQSFILRNTGTVAAFALLTVRCKALYPFMDSNVKVEPSAVAIPARQEVTVRVLFRPRRDDFKYLHTASAAVDVSEIASVQILTGPEPTRARIRRLFGKMQQHGGGGGMPILSSDLLISKLSATLPGEQMPADVTLCKEGAAGLKELLRDLETRELTLTVERDDAERHGFVSLLGADDTCVFQSVCDETTNMTFDDRTLRAVDPQPQRRVSGGFCTLEPTKLLLTPPAKSLDTVILSSRHSRPMPFEIACTSDAVQVSPQVGVVAPAGTTLIHVSYRADPPDTVHFHKIMVYVENEVMDIEVKVVNIKTRRAYT